MRTSLLAFALAAVAVLGCYGDVESFANRHVTAGERQFSIEYLTLLQSGQVDSAYAHLAPELRNGGTRMQLEGMPGMLADVSLDSMVLIGANVLQGSGNARHVNLSYETPSEHGYVMANVATRRLGDSVFVEGFSAQPTAESLFTLHAFTLSDRDLVHYVWLGLLAVIPLLCIWACVLVIRSKGMPRRWLWAVIALIAGPVFVLNWTTGFWEIRLLSVTFLGAGAVNGGPMTPWILSFGLPLGAALALWKRSQWRAQLTSTSDEVRTGGLTSASS